MDIAAETDCTLSSAVEQLLMGFIDLKWKSIIMSL